MAHGREVMRILLEALTQIDEDWLRRYPGRYPPIHQSGVRYEREPPGQEEWLDIPQLLEEGKGDCEDLACWRAAELRVQGYDAHPDFTCRKVELPGGRSLRVFHIVVRIGPILEDPSRDLGMGAPSREYLDSWRGAIAAGAVASVVGEGGIPCYRL